MDNIIVIIGASVGATLIVVLIALGILKSRKKTKI